MDGGNWFYGFGCRTSGCLVAKTIRWPNVGLMLGHRLRRRHSIKTTLGQRLVLFGMLCELWDLLPRRPCLGCRCVSFHSKQDTLTQCWLNVRPASQKLGPGLVGTALSQHWAIRSCLLGSVHIVLIPYMMVYGLPCLSKWLDTRPTQYQESTTYSIIAICWYGDMYI